MINVGWRQSTDFIKLRKADSLNTQSSTQWDGFRHVIIILLFQGEISEADDWRKVSHLPTKTFYNNTKHEDILGPNSNLKNSIHYLSEHGICGRGVLLDYWSYAQKKGKWYDCCERNTISYEELEACAKDQGIDIRPESQGGNIKVGDILLVRSGYTVQMLQKPAEEWSKLALRDMEQQNWAGVEDSEKVVDWLHDCYFAAVAGDASSFEAWPPVGGWFPNASGYPLEILMRRRYAVTLVSPRTLGMSNRGVLGLGEAERALPRAQ